MAGCASADEYGRHDPPTKETTMRSTTRRYYCVMFDGTVGGVAGVQAVDPADEPVFAAALFDWAHPARPEHLGPELTRDEAVELCVGWWRSDDAGADHILSVDLILDRRVRELRPN
jgi:hypothetical protein